MEAELIKIVKGDHNLLKINIHSKGNSFDFVILLDHKFVIHYIGKYSEEQTYLVDNNIDGVHITYHSSKIYRNSNKTPELHLKNNRKILNVFDKITDINIDTEFPIPLFKIIYNTEANKLTSNSNMDDTIDLYDYGGNPKEYNLEHKNINTVEVYFASKSYIDYPSHAKKWPGLNYLQMLSSIDYVVRGIDVRPDIIDDFAKGNILLAQEGHIYDQYALMIRKYYDKDIKANSIYFYENINYIDMLATTPIQLTTEIGEQNRHYSLLYRRPFTAAYLDPFSGIFPAFCYDLDMQLENGTTFNEVNRWHNIFNNSMENVRKSNIKRKGLIIPQI